MVIGLDLKAAAEERAAERLAVEFDRSNEQSGTAPQVRFRSDLRVALEPRLTCGSDRMMARPAWCVSPGEDRPATSGGEDEAAVRRLLKACVGHRHTSPLEHGLMTVHIEAPMTFWFQLTRHRFLSLDVEDFGLSLSSGRYRQLDGTFYVPQPERPCFEPKGFKPMRPKLVSASEFFRSAEPMPSEHDGDGYALMQWVHRRDELEKLVGASSRRAHEFAYGEFKRMIDAGVGREVARLVLGPASYYSGYVNGKPLTWLHFFSLRMDDPANKYPTHPQWEIEEVARGCERLFKERWPIAHAEFVAAGRTV